MVLAIRVEQIERTALALLQVNATVAAAGGQPGELVSPEQAVEDFLVALDAPVEPGEPIDPEQWELRRALGVA